MVLTVAGSPALGRVLLLWVSQDLVSVLPSRFHSSLGPVLGPSISEAMGLAAVWAWVFAPPAQTAGVRPLPLEGVQSRRVR